MPSIPTLLRSLALLAAGLALVACASSEPDPVPPAPREWVTPSVWRCTTLEDDAVTEVVLTLEIDAEGRAGGRSAVNRWFGGTFADDGSADLARLGTTRMAGTSEALDLERRYLDALGRSTRWYRKGGRLELGDGERVLLVFGPPG